MYLGMEGEMELMLSHTFITQHATSWQADKL